MKTLFSALITLFALVACKPAETIVSAQPEQLVGEWQLVEPAASYKVTLRFAKRPDMMAGFAYFQLSGRAPVNGYGAQANFSKGPSIESGPLGSGNVWDIISTMIAGTPEANQFEQTYLTNLGAVNRYELTSKNRLRLYYNGAQPGVLVYERVQ